MQCIMQGCVERRNGIVKTKLKAARRQYPGMDWPDLLAMVQEQVNNGPTRVLGGLPPTAVLFGQPNYGLSAPAAMGMDRWAWAVACVPCAKCEVGCPGTLWLVHPIRQQKGTVDGCMRPNSLQYKAYQCCTIGIMPDLH